MRMIRIVGLWVLQALMAVAMVGPGVQKFTSPMWQRMFRTWGYPEHFYLVIGAIEVVCGVALLVPKLAAPAATTLMVVMLGAGVTQLMNGRNCVGELVFFTLLGVIAYARRSHWTRRANAGSAEPVTAP